MGTPTTTAVTGRRAPDGGWGWVVVIASAVSQMFTIGLLWALSVFYVSWIEEFDQSKGLTSWVISLGFSLLFGAGPISASLASRFGTRAVVITGSLMTSLGIIVSYWAFSVEFLILSIGLFSGLGCGLIYVSAVAIVAVYFDRKRSLASGISLSGVSVGSFILAPLLGVLEEGYGWRGAILIVGALTLNLVVCGLVMRPLDLGQTATGTADHRCPRDDPGKYNAMPASGQRGVVDAASPFVSSGSDDQTHDDDDDHVDREMTSGSVHDLANAHKMATSNGHAALLLPAGTASDGGNKNDSGGGLPGLPRPKFLTVEPERVAGSLTDLKTAAGDCNGPEPRASSTGDLRERRFQKTLTDEPHHHLTGSAACFKNLVLVSTPSASRADLAENMAANEDHDVTSKRYHQVETTRKSVSSPKRRSFLASVAANFQDAIQTNVDLMKDLHFMILAISHMLLCIAAFTVSVYMVDRVVFFGIDKSSGAMLVSVNAAFNFFGRISCGFLADRVCKDHLALYIVTVGVSAVATLLSPLCRSSVLLQGLYAAVIGFSTGGASTLTLVVNVDIMGVAQVASSYGLMMTFMGLGNLAGMPLAGWLFDWTQAYTIPYIVLGLFFLVADLMLLFLYFLTKRQTKPRHEKAFQLTVKP